MQCLLCSDWEHITVRLTPDGQSVLGVYYSCHRCHPLATEAPAAALRSCAFCRALLHPQGTEHFCEVHSEPCRHIDGTWRSAHEVPRTPEGRPEAYVAINGHGVYPEAGRIIRLFGAFNDNTSREGGLGVGADEAADWALQPGDPGLPVNGQGPLGWFHWAVRFQDVRAAAGCRFTELLSSVVVALCWLRQGRTDRSQRTASQSLQHPFFSFFK